MRKRLAAALLCLCLLFILLLITVRNICYLYKIDYQKSEQKIALDRS